MTLQSFLDNFDNSIDLRDSENAHIFQTLEVSIALRHTPRHDDWFASLLGFLDEVNELLLGWIFDRARIEEASVSLVDRINDFVAVVSQKTCHVFAV